MQKEEIYRCYGLLKVPTLPDFQRIEVREIPISHNKWSTLEEAEYEANIAISRQNIIEVWIVKQEIYRVVGV